MKKCILVCLVLLLTIGFFAESAIASKASDTIKRITDKAKAVTEKSKSGKDNTVDDEDVEVDSIGLGDDIDYEGLQAYFERQADYESSIRGIIQRRLSEYWGAELKDFSLFLDDSFFYGEADVESIATINVSFIWDVHNSNERTKNMLRMYSDDLSATVHNAYPDVPIKSLCVFWEVPYIIDKGNAAKYIYYSIGDKMYLEGAYGPLYGRN